MRSIVVLLPLLSFAMGACSSRAGAQQRGDRVSIDAAIEHLRAGSTHLAVQILTGSLGSFSTQERDAFADSLVRIVLSVQRGDRPESARLRGRALFALGGAGSRSQSHPYPGAFQRLAAIVENSTEIPIRATALLGLSMLHDQGPVLPYVRQIVLSDDPLASDAISVLVEDFGEAGFALLRELYHGGRVQHPDARARLEMLARQRGWR
jgi:hypothetical protein